MNDPPKPPQTTQLSFPLPTTPDTKIHLHLTPSSSYTLLLVATSSPASPATTSSLGSFVYALPSTNASSQPLSTALYTRTSSVDFATRLARILARRTGKPAYVGGECRFWVQEEEGEALRGCVEVVLGVLGVGRLGNGVGNGDA